MGQSRRSCDDGCATIKTCLMDRIVPTHVLGQDRRFCHGSRHVRLGKVNF
jgi:hypothetical protein